MTKILIVCMGNICRSPMAHIVTSHFAEQARLARTLKIDSAGTHAAHHGEPPDPRAKACLSGRGYTVGRSRSRPVSENDFSTHDLILAMDHANLRDLRRLCPLEHQPKLRLFLSFAPVVNEQEVPDPYYGSAQGFERVLDLCEAGAHGLIRYLQNSPH
jgi:protein-tyrosine phosphatase